MRAGLAALWDLMPPRARASPKPRGPAASALQPSEGRGPLSRPHPAGVAAPEAAATMAQGLAAMLGLPAPLAPGDPKWALTGDSGNVRPELMGLSPPQPALPAAARPAQSQALAHRAAERVLAGRSRGLAGALTPWPLGA